MCLYWFSVLSGSGHQIQGFAENVPKIVPCFQNKENDCAFCFHNGGKWAANLIYRIQFSSSCKFILTFKEIWAPLTLSPQLAEVSSGWDMCVPGLLPYVDLCFLGRFLGLPQAGSQPVFWTGHHMSHDQPLPTLLVLLRWLLQGKCRPGFLSPFTTVILILRNPPASAS